MIDEVTPAILREFLAYDSDGGTLFWKPRGKEHFETGWQCARWNKKYAGREAFASVNASGYRAGVLWRRGVLAHRVIWAIVHGSWPAFDIDHIDHDRLNNRIENLRCVTRAENARNRSKQANSRSRRVGVAWNDRLNKWCAIGSIDGRTTHLGSFVGFPEACERRRQFEIERGYHENHGMQRWAA